jgi:FMN phosphatase YigB (HAD superfamily)
MPIPQKRFQHLLLDLDGTLIHSGNFLLNFEFIARILPMLKKFRGWKVALRTLKEMQDVVKTPSKIKTNQERVVEIFQTNFGISQEEAEKHLLKSIQTVFPQLESHFGKILGAADFVDWAKDHFTLTLATNPMWTTEFVHMRMRWGGINPDYFRSITTADRMHACKPLPEYYRELLDQEKFEVRDCLLVGNERRMDLPAIQTGLAVYLIRPATARLTCIQEPGSTVHFKNHKESHNGGMAYVSPGAWRGNYAHLKELLLSSPK